MIAVILLNIYLHNYFVGKAIKNIVKPILDKKGLHLVKTEWTGLFNQGDFRRDRRYIIPSLSPSYPTISTYVYIFYIDGLLKKRMTIRIDVSMFSIKKNFFSDNSVDTWSHARW